MKVEISKRLSTALVSMLLGLLLGGCQTGAALRLEAETIQNQLNAAREVGAYRCAPIELARAESHLEFLLSELGQGNAVRAAEHRHVAKKALVTVLERSKGCKPEEPNDRDGDTVPDENDACPDTPGPVELLGCPDTDGDTVLDRDDSCVDVPGPVENKGCPYGDKDGDTVLDKDDGCIDVPGPVENKGCPYGDKDKDGVLDNQDQCIDVPGPVENKGCPFGDRDGDGILDKDDQCVDAPEDKDGWEDEDGCPDPDNDSDGIPDVKDNCPMQAETMNGHEDEDGCPDQVLKLVEVDRKAGQIKIKQKVYFSTGKARIKRRSYDLLDEVAQAINSNQDLKVIVEGHTDSVGSASTNMRLSERRANAVRDYLISKGNVDGSRVTAMGYGEEKQIDTNRTRAGRSRNRRVQFTIAGKE